MLTLIVAMLTIAAQEAIESTETIPLETIWALDMPYTKNVRQLEPKVFGKHFSQQNVESQQKLLAESLILQIKQALGEPQAFLAKEGTSSRLQGFAVEGTGLQALQKVHRILVKKQKPQEKFKEDSEMSICFFSLQAGTYVHVTSVEQRVALCRVQYQFVPHLATVMSEHLAIIPFGPKKKGMISVTIDRESKKELNDASSQVVIPTEWEENLISKSFDFIIE